MSTEESIELEMELREAVRIDPRAMEEEFVRIAPLIAYFGEKHSRAIRAHLEAKRASKRTQSFVSMRVRGEFKARGDKPTEGMVGELVDQDPEVDMARRAEDDAEVERERLKSQMEALRAKRDALIQLGSTFRAEMLREPSIREHLRTSRLMEPGGEEG